MAYGISEKEKLMYDRQIRVWGFEAQKLMRNSAVLLIGCGNASAEICKNLVLAGIGSLTVSDLEAGSLVAQSDLESVFCFSKERLGQNRAEALCGFLSELNPNVDIRVEKDQINEKEKSFYRKFDIICVSESPLIFSLKMSEIARKLEKPFFVIDLLGDTGIIFSDLTHSFSYRLKDAKEDSRANYCSLAASLATPLSVFKRRRQREKIVFAVFKAICVLEEREGRLPVVTDQPAVLQILAEANELNPTVHEKASVVSKTILSSMSKRSTSCAAVIGGIAAQEVLKALSHTGRPLCNWLLFGTATGSAAIEITVMGNK